jgi:hypothetical protein
MISEDRPNRDASKPSPAFSDEPLVPMGPAPEPFPDSELPRPDGRDPLDALELLAPTAAVIGEELLAAPPMVEVVAAPLQPDALPEVLPDASVAQRINAYKRAVEESTPLARGQVERDERVDPNDRFEQLVRIVVTQQPFQLGLRQAVITSIVDSLGQARIDEVRTL